jgi:ABC-2 type transport system ATP-binding protein
VAPVAVVRGVPGVHSVMAEESTDATTLRVSLVGEDAIGAVVSAVVAAGARVVSMNKDEPTLEDVFIELVGHGLNQSPDPRP